MSKVKDMGVGTGVCATCHGWLRLDSAMTAPDGRPYHQGCPDPQPISIQPVAKPV